MISQENHFNPLHPTDRPDDRSAKYHMILYNETDFQYDIFEKAEDCLQEIPVRKKCWIHVEGIIHSEVEKLCNYYNIHSLFIEDILSADQRAKMDDAEGVLFFLLYAIRLTPSHQHIKKEQISIVVGKNFVISFEERKNNSCVQELLQKLQARGGKFRIKEVDYLCYMIIDHIVDNYYPALEKMGEVLEQLESEIMGKSNHKSLAKVNMFRKEILLMKKQIVPVRDILSNLLKNDNRLFSEKTKKYFKDVYDHINQAYDTVESYRDMMITLQELYINKLNMRMNEVMKVLAIVTCLMAPASVISGIFGMNFSNMPALDNNMGFYVAIAIMFIIPVLMLIVFKKRNWF